MHGPFRLSGVAVGRILSAANEDNGASETGWTLSACRDTPTTGTDLVKVEEGCYLLNCLIDGEASSAGSVSCVSALPQGEFRVPGGCPRSLVPRTVHATGLFIVRPW